MTQTELAERYGVQRRTIYSRLERLDGEPFEQAVQDDHRSGRPRELTDEHQSEVDEVRHQSPTDVGVDTPAWMSTVPCDFLEETFDLDYSLPNSAAESRVAPGRKALGTATRAWQPSGSLGELDAAIDDALSTSSVVSMSNYFY